MQRTKESVTDRLHTQRVAILLMSLLLCGNAVWSQGANDRPFWKETGSLSIDRTLHTATLLQIGKVVLTENPVRIVGVEVETPMELYSRSHA